MAQVIRKTEATFPGPWLLDNAALTALDEVIDEQWLRLEAYKKRQIGQDHESDSGDGRTITLTLSSGNKIRVNSFREAANDVHCQDHEISKIEVKLSCAGIRGDMVVPTPKRELSLVALPEANDAADELFVRLNGWAKQYAPDWLRQVRSWGFPLAWILGLSLLLPVVLLGGMTGAISETNTWRNEVDELLSAGVGVENHSRALELLLQKAAGLDQRLGTLHLPVWFGVVAVTLAVVATLLSIPAHTAFEIGKGTASVRRQKRYDWFLRKALPTFLIMGVLASVVGTYAVDFLRAK